MGKNTFTVTLNSTGQKKSVSINIIDLYVEEIEILDLDEGSDNSGSNDPKGMIHGKEYTLQVKKFKDDKEPKNENIIYWRYKYTADDGSVADFSIDKKGKKITFKADDLDYCGKKITFYAFISDKEQEGKLDVFHHYRFRWFDRGIFEKGLNKRKDNPALIQQHSTSLCGTAAILYQLAKDDKHLFYNAYMKFFIKGESKVNAFTLKPNKKLYDMKPETSNKTYPNYDKYSNNKPIVPPDIMEQADWIILAGTRSSDNKSYEGEDGENWDAINWPSYMKKAALDLYGASSAKDETSIITGFDYTKTLKTIDEEYNKGWKFIFMIDSDMLDDEVSYIGCMTQYHWIVYEGDLNINTIKNEFTFSYWCWHKLNNKKTFRKKVFNTNFYGYLKYK